MKNKQGLGWAHSGTPSSKRGLRYSGAGFTLIEMLVVLSIVALLAVVALAALQDARNKGRYAQMLNQMSIIARAAEAYRTDTGLFASGVGEGLDPVFVSDLNNKWLQAWPDTPCKNPGKWLYDWDGVISNGRSRVEIVENVPPGTWTARFTYCVSRDGAGSCGAVLGTEVNTRPIGRLTC